MKIFFKKKRPIWGWKKRREKNVIVKKNQPKSLLFNVINVTFNTIKCNVGTILEKEQDIHKPALILFSLENIEAEKEPKFSDWYLATSSLYTKKIVYSCRKFSCWTILKSFTALNTCYKIHQPALPDTKSLMKEWKNIVLRIWLQVNSWNIFYWKL